MHRLFVALRPPAAMRRQLLAMMGGGSGVRWQSDDQLHLTIRFIGEVDIHQAEDIAAALGSVHAPPVRFGLSGAGLFDRRGVPDSLWAGIAPQEGLTTLYERVNRALARVGIGAEARAFLPHITVARLSRSIGPIGDLIAPWSALSAPDAVVSHFELFESRLGHAGATYETIARYPLG